MNFYKYSIFHHTAFAEASAGKANHTAFAEASAGKANQ
jgi:hypothetical protein